MINIFDEQTPIDDSNFLDYDIKKLKTANSIVQFRDAIDRLDGLRDVLKIIKNINRISDVGNRAYYIEALRWLKGETPLNNWHHVPHSPNLEALAPDVAQAFDLYTQQLKQNLEAEPLFSQTQLAIQVAPLIKTRPIAKSIEDVVSAVRDDIATTASVKKQRSKALQVRLSL